MILKSPVTRCVRIFLSRARYFGGSCNLWAGRSMKLTELDVTPREWIPQSGWPIAYAELEHYYGLAEKDPAATISLRDSRKSRYAVR